MASHSCFGPTPQGKKSKAFSQYNMSGAVVLNGASAWMQDLQGGHF